MNVSHLNDKKALMIFLWISLTLGQVAHRLSDRPAEIVSSLIIAVAVIGLFAAFMLVFSRFQRMTSTF